MLNSAGLIDAIADWYEHGFLGSSRSRVAHPPGIDRARCALLGSGRGACLELGCGTGEWGALVSSLGWAPVGIDTSAGMLAYARRRLPIVEADAARLPVGSSRLSAVISVMVHTDMSDYPDVVREAARVLRPGGSFVHFGVHPCFCGGFADRSDPNAVVVRAGYLDSNWTTTSWTTHGVRDKVGATHWPLPELFGALIAAGLVPDRLLEGGEPVPTVLAIRARKPMLDSAQSTRREHVQPNADVDL